jgi:arylsulfatase
MAANIAARARRLTTLYPGMARIDRYHVPDLTDRSFQIRAYVELPAEGAEGVLVSIGCRFGGLVLFVQDGRFVAEYVYADDERTVLRSGEPLPAGRSLTLAYAFTRTGSRQGDAALLVDGREVGRAHLLKTWPAAGLAGGLHCGRDGGSPVSDGYELPFAFSGTLQRIEIELGGARQVDDRAGARAAMVEE